MPVIVLTLEADGQPLAIDCCDERYSPVRCESPGCQSLAIRDNQTGTVVHIRETPDEIDAILAQAHAADGGLRARKQR